MLCAVTVTAADGWFFRVGHGLDWIGLNWIGWNNCDPFLISNHCSTVDAVSYKL